MDLASRIQLTCFVASYSISIVGECLRVFWPRRALRWITTGFAIAGIAAHTLYLVHRAILAGQLPIATQFESLIAVSWLISLVYLYLLVRDRRLGVGVFVLPISLGMIIFAATMADRGLRPAGEHNLVIAVSHGIAFLIGITVVIAAFVSALMYLVKMRQLRTGSAVGHVRLPSLERLDRTNTIAVYVAYAFLTIGMLLGFLLQQLAWTDPKSLSTLAAWGLFTCLVHVRHHPENRGRKVAILTIVACVMVFVSVLGDPLFGTGHQAVPESSR